MLEVGDSVCVCGLSTGPHEVRPNGLHVHSNQRPNGRPWGQRTPRLHGPVGAGTIFGGAVGWELHMEVRISDEGAVRRPPIPQAIKG